MTVVALLRNTVSLPERIARINEHWQRAESSREAYVTSIIKVGEELIAAQEQDGDSLREMADKLPFTWSAVSKLATISKNPVFLRGKHRNCLPAAWTMLYELAQLSDDVLEAGLRDGTIHPEMSRKNAIALKPIAPHEPTGTRAKVLAVIKDAKDGMTTDEVRVALPKEHAQTINTAVNDLAKQGWLKPTGERRTTRAAGRRKAIVYAEVQPAPTKHTPTKHMSKADQIVEAIENEKPIVKALERWKIGKSHKQIISKAVHLAYALVGRSPYNFTAMHKLLMEEAKADGRLSEM